MKENSTRIKGFGASAIFAIIASPVLADLDDYSTSEINAAPICTPFPAGEAFLLCQCPAGFGTTSVWGSGPYTGDSNICAAALHAGAISKQGGPVFAQKAPGQASYAGSSSNGVITSDWQGFEFSFTIDGSQTNTVPKQTSDAALKIVDLKTVEVCKTLPKNVDIYSCNCPANASTAGSVWGSGPYTTDSNLCAAARHSGVIGTQGGDVVVLRLQGLSHYSSSQSGGVTTSEWGNYADSFMVNHN